MKKVELLAPAGNYEALVGAIAAGADAVYLGGNAFGARAYADNFTQEEICEGIRYAHVFQKKIYLTVNTLVKEKEFSSLYDFLLPIYDAGLDGVIIQDLGVFSFIRRHFPGLMLHVSTQMTITGKYGASLLKREGACRIVPARELSIDEIKAIKNEVDIEIETFIHGAMCYCYSGQCLFSSILGGRSGNRGRCAQPCRLPYRINAGKEEYPLSMKDMCTIHILPELIEAGIDSFKIEGRMKKPEYAAGVTAIYRKYIDKYYENSDGNLQTPYRVSEKDMKMLTSLYIRSSVSEGYYHQHNGKNMITLSSPSYSGSDEQLLADIRKQYIEKKKVLPVTMEAFFKVNERCRIELCCQKNTVSLEGPLVNSAEKQPLTADRIKNQLLKSGGTIFEIISVAIDADDNIFIPVSVQNKLRRDGLALLMNHMIEQNGLAYKNRKAVPFSIDQSDGLTKYNKKNTKTAVHALISNKEQLRAAFKADAMRIYVDKLSCDEDLISSLISYKQEKHIEVYLAFPYIVRKRCCTVLERLFELLNLSVFDGALVRNLETLAFLEEKNNQKPIVTDFNLYAFNRQAYDSLKEKAKEVYFPVELNSFEWKELQSASMISEDEVSVIVYGRLPMMISAGCLKKTKEKCDHQSGWNTISDRYQKKFPVYNDCTYCYNVIYNSVPLSLHKLFHDGSLRPGICRLDFTKESGEETEKIISYFRKLTSGQFREPFYKEYTTGHYKRGVE